MICPVQSVKEPQLSLSESWGLVYLGLKISNICEKQELFQLQFASFFETAENSV